jgi:hypothetical protein
MAMHCRQVFFFGQLAVRAHDRSLRHRHRFGQPYPDGYRARDEACAPTTATSSNRYYALSGSFSATHAAESSGIALPNQAGSSPSHARR